MVILMYSKSMMPLLNILVHAGLVAKTLELFETAQAFQKNAFRCKNIIKIQVTFLYSLGEQVVEEKPCHGSWFQGLSRSKALKSRTNCDRDQ